MKHTWIFILMLFVSVAAVQIAVAENKYDTVKAPPTAEAKPLRPAEAKTPVGARESSETLPPARSDTRSVDEGRGSGGLGSALADVWSIFGGSNSSNTSNNSNRSTGGSTSQGTAQSRAPSSSQARQPATAAPARPAAAPRPAAPATQNRAQTVVAPVKPFSLALLGGVGVSTHKPVENLANYDDSDSFLFTGGVSFGLNFDALSLSAELLVGNESFQARGHPGGGPYEFDMTSAVLQIPVIVKYKFGSGSFKLYPLAGLYLNFAVAPLHSEMKSSGN
jgi:hypothetical protein